MRKMGPSTNTGAKGVLNEYTAYQEQAMRVREAKDKELLRQARRGMLQGSKAEREEVTIVLFLCTLRCLSFTYCTLKS